MTGVQTCALPILILGAILFGPLAGGILGATFGVCSMISNTFAPKVLSFAFSPFLAVSLPGSLKAVWISVGCRMMIGVVAGWLWIALKKVRVNDLIALPVAGFVGSMTNTVFVMGSIYFLLRPEYAEAMGVGIEAVLDMVLGIITGSSVLEAIVALVLVTAIGKVLLHVPYLRPGAQPSGN